RRSSDLVALRSKSDTRHAEPSHVLLAWSGLGRASGSTRVFDPTAEGAVPPGLRTSASRKPTWSDDGRVVFVGLAPWTEKTGDEPRTASNGSKSPDEADADEAASVDVWHPHDVDVMPKQKLSARADRRRTLLAAWHLETNKVVQLAVSAQES